MQTGIRLVKILTCILSKFSCYSYNERVTFYFIYRYFLFNSGTNDADAKAHLPKKPRLCDVCTYLFLIRSSKSDPDTPVGL